VPPVFSPQRSQSRRLCRCALRAWLLYIGMLRPRKVKEHQGWGRHTCRRCRWHAMQ
jgi:hypothetical protein